MNLPRIRFSIQFQLVIKLLIIFGVLAISFLVGQFVPPKFLVYILILILGVGALLIYTMNPLLGLVAILTGSMLLSVELGTGTATKINIVIILLPILMGVWFVD